jgi:hypothetical protein
MTTRRRSLLPWVLAAFLLGLGGGLARAGWSHGLGSTRLCHDSHENRWLQWTSFTVDDAPQKVESVDHADNGSLGAGTENEIAATLYDGGPWSLRTLYLVRQ